MIREEGPGWRIERDSSRKKYTSILGGEDWALELTEQEWNSLRTVVNDLLDQHRKLQNQLMKEESLELEIERHPWWACLEGDRSCWSLQLILSGDSKNRGFEAFWPIPAAQALVGSMRKIWDSP